MRQERSADKLASAFVDVSLEDAKVYPHRETECSVYACLDKVNSDKLAIEEDKGKGGPFELYKRRTTVVVGRNFFLNVVCGALSEYKYVGLNQRADLILASRIRERKEYVTVLLCGTSGCGKSTLSALLRFLMEHCEVSASSSRLRIYAEEILSSLSRY